MLQGGCFCGAVRYQADGEPFHMTSCHCSHCRRTSGAPFVTWFSIPRRAFRIIRGTPTRFASSAHATRSFCAHCGTQLTFEHVRSPDEIDVTTCSLDEPEALPPEDHTYTRSRLSWVRLDDRLPQHATTRRES